MVQRQSAVQVLHFGPVAVGGKQRSEDGRGGTLARLRVGSIRGSVTTLSLATVCEGGQGGVMGGGVSLCCPH